MVISRRFWEDNGKQIYQSKERMCTTREAIVDDNNGNSVFNGDENLIERFSIKCRKTKTKVITLANQKGQRQSGKPIKTRSNYTLPLQSAGK